jgi:hypothetical protein
MEIIPLTNSGTPTHRSLSHRGIRRVPQRTNLDHTLGHVEHPCLPSRAPLLAKSGTPACQVGYPSALISIIPSDMSTTPACQVGYPSEQVRSGTRTSTTRHANKYDPAREQVRPGTRTSTTRHANKIDFSRELSTLASRIHMGMRPLYPCRNRRYTAWGFFQIATRLTVISSSSVY